MKVTARKGKIFLKPEGELTVARAAEFKDVLVNSLDKAEEIEINLADVSRIDLASLQLMCSAHLTASRQGKSLTIKDPSVPVFKKARTDAGFEYSKSCRLISTDDCLWVEKGEQ